MVETMMPNHGRALAVDLGERLEEQPVLGGGVRHLGGDHASSR